MLLRCTRRCKASCVQLHGGLLHQGVSHVKHTAQGPSTHGRELVQANSGAPLVESSAFFIRSASTLSMLADRLQIASMALECKSEPYGLLAAIPCSAFSTAMRLSVDFANSSSVYGLLCLFSG